MVYKTYFLIIALVLSNVVVAQDIEEITLSKQLKKGWNLLGYDGDVSLPIDSALNQILGKIEVVKNADGFYFAEQQKHLNSLDSLRHGDGYFVKVNEDCIYSWTDFRYNYAPENPLAIFPENGATGVGKSFYLSWKCTDRENEVLTFTILLDDNPIPATILTSNYKVDSIQTHELKYETTYYWQVIVEDEYGHEVESEIFTFKTEMSNETEGTVTDYDGNVYPWKKIGEQRWMTKNLRTTHFADGTEIPIIESASNWKGLSLNNTACVYPDTTGTGYEYYDKEEFGLLYTWAAATNGNSDTVNVQGVCPTGWHLPSDEEWTELEVFLALNGHNYDGTITSTRSKVSNSMAKDWEWNIVNVNFGGNGAPGDLNYKSKRNSSGFSGVPSGTRDINGYFVNIGDGTAWWSSTFAYSEYAWYHALYYTAADVFRRCNIELNRGLPVRCVKD